MFYTALPTIENQKSLLSLWPIKIVLIFLFLRQPKKTLFIYLLIKQQRE